MSNYGPKKLKLYNENDNLRRKENNTTTELKDLGNNYKVKSYANKESLISNAKQVQREAERLKRLNKKQPVKIYSPEEIEIFKKKWA